MAGDTVVTNIRGATVSDGTLDASLVAFSYVGGGFFLEIARLPSKSIILHGVVDATARPPLHGSVNGVG